MKTIQRFRYQLNLISFIIFITTTAAVAQEASITIKRVEALPTNPSAEEWQAAPATEVAVTPQQVTMPALAEAAIDKITVQALTDGKAIAWRLAWQDDAADANVDVGRFSDAVAIELPLNAGASPMMGHRGGGKVQILYWKGLWQKDLDEGFQDVEDVHPNYWSDLYWFADGQFPYRIPDAFKNPYSQQWFIAKTANNPVADFNRQQPVQELVAEGWGTLTHQPNSVTRGKGVWADGKWNVVFSRPLTTTDPNDYQFNGDKGEMAFAVWQGSKNNVGGRKHWSNWTPYQIQP